MNQIILGEAKTDIPKENVINRDWPKAKPKAAQALWALVKANSTNIALLLLTFRRMPFCGAVIVPWKTM